jgi:isopentenyl-diphosphate Delta-isomerase
MASSKSKSMSERSRSDNSADDVILVDEHDRALGTMAKLSAHQRGLRHRAVSVIVRDRNSRLLLQQRAATKYHSGGLWTNTCCSHPRPGEDTLEAASRRLREEMGVACELAFLFSTHYRADVSRGLIEDEIVHVFGGRFDGTPDPDPLEVADWSWQDPDTLARDLDENPEKYTVWFREYCRRFWPAMVG